MPDAFRDDDRSPEIPQPTQEPITWKRRNLTPGLILDLWRRGMRQRQQSRARILACREFRRMAEDTLVQLSPKWQRQHPEGVSWVVEALEERISLDSNMVARVGAVEPEFDCEPIDSDAGNAFTETAGDLAEAKEAYLEEWKKSEFGIPTQAFFGKGTEDGEYARVRLPSDVDMEGDRTFFETLDERAYRAMDERERSTYVEDEDTPPGMKRSGKTRYVKVDDRGRKQVRDKYKAPTDDASKQKHLADIRRYLLDKPASVARVIPALDCVGGFTRGKGRTRWDLSYIVERTLYYVEELIDQEYAWEGMGDRLLVPRAYDADGRHSGVVPSSDVGGGGQVYLYTAYLVCKDDDGHERPIIAYTVGGASTSWGTGADPDDEEQVGLVDLFETHGLQGPLWSYHGGLHTEDDDPDHYWQPYLWRFIRRIRGIEGNKTAINAATQVTSFPGQYYRPDAAIAALENADEFLLEQDGELRRPKVARSGEIEPAVGEIFNAPPPAIGADAWRQLQADLLALQAATAVDQPPPGNQSGTAQMIQITTGATAKRHIREGVLEAATADAQDHLKIVDAVYRTRGIKWPLQTVDEQPVGSETRTGSVPAEYDPRWIGGGNFSLKMRYPEEQNLAQQDMEMKAAMAGFGNFDRVAKAMGEKDTERARMKADRDRLLKTPAVDAMRLMRVAKKLGDRELEQIAKLQAQQLMAPTEVPGMSGGIPTDSLKRPGEGQGVPGAGTTSGAAARAGEIGGAVNADRAAANAEAALTQTGPGVAA